MGKQPLVSQKQLSEMRAAVEAWYFGEPNVRYANIRTDKPSRARRIARQMRVWFPNCEVVIVSGEYWAVVFDRGKVVVQ